VLLEGTYPITRIKSLNHKIDTKLLSEDNKPYGKDVDIWSVKIIAYLLLVGVLPFDDEKDSEIA